MVAIRKKFVVNAIKILLAIAVIFGAAYGQRLLDATWQDEHTWATSATVVLPKELKNLNLEKVQQGNTISITVPYCTLYDVKVSDSNREYYCSLLPWYSWQRFQYDPKLASEENQVVIKVPKSAPSPVHFLGRLDVSNNSLDTIGSKPIPVSIRIAFTSIRPDKNLVVQFSHWRKASIGQTEETQQTVTSWEVNKIVAYEDLTTAQKKQFAKDFGNNVVTFFNEKVGLQQKLQEAKTDKTYFMALYNIFKYGSYNCSKDISEYGCDLGYQQNPAESIMYYYYLTQGTKFGQSLKQQLLGHMLPFQSETSPAVPTCVDRANCDSYFDYTMYQYQVCPRIALYRTDYDPEIFTSYYTARAPAPDSLPAIRSALELLPINELGSSMEVYDLQRTQIKDFSERINSICYTLIKKHAPQKDFDELLELSHKAIWFDLLYADLSGEIKRVDRQHLEAFVYYSTVLQPYKVTLVPNYLLAISTSFTGISDMSYEKDLHVTFDIVRSLMLSYLIAPNE